MAFFTVLCMKSVSFSCFNSCSLSRFGLVFSALSIMSTYFVTKLGYLSCTMYSSSYTDMLFMDISYNRLVNDSNTSLLDLISDLNLSTPLSVSFMPVSSIVQHSLKYLGSRRHFLNMSDSGR